MLEYNKALRRQLFVDPKIQGTLIGRIVLYWAGCVVTIALMLLFWQVITGPAGMLYTHFYDMWLFYGPAAIATLLLLPFVIWDIVRISNRFVGPFLRLRSSMRALARGEETEPIEFRDDDFWHDFADEFNAIRARMQRLSSQSRSKSESENEDLLGVGI